jgi:spore germination protein YaaH
MSVHARIKRAVALAIALGTTLAFGPQWQGTPPAAGFDTSAAEAGQESMWYQQVLEHAHDQIEFTPGDAVTVPYVPRPGDRTLINGKYPVALPAGRASGRSMAATPNDTIWAFPDAEQGNATDQGGIALSGRATQEYAPRTTTVGAPPEAAGSNVLRREVYGYLPYWESGAGASLNYDILSTVAYFGVTVRGDGTLGKSTNGSTTTEWAGWTSSWMTNVINNAHSHGTRVSLSVEQFAWTSGGRDTQVMLLSSADYRLRAAQGIAAAVRDRGADGVSLDFEPIVSSQSANFVTFVQTLRSELNKINPGYELIYDATGSIGYYAHAQLTAAGGADAVWIMGYDFRTGSSSYAGSIDPLTSPRNVYDLTQVVNSYKSKISVSKIILGLPWYGIAWSTTSHGLNANVLTGSGCSPTSVFFNRAAALAAQNGRNYDSIEQSAWTAYQLDCGDKDANGQPTLTWRELYYDDAQSLGVRYDMINYWNLRGMGIWALGYDAGYPEMTSLIANKFLTDKTPPVAGIVNLPAVQSDEGFPVSWTARDDWNGVVSYDVQVSTDGGPFADWLTGVTATEASFQGLDGHTYSFRVRATDGVGNVGPWDVPYTYTAEPTYAVNGFIAAQVAISERASPSSSATAIQSVPAGGILQIIGGPSVDAGGVTWYQVTGPFSELDSLAPLFPGLWVAVTDGTTNWALPITAPNTTAVDSGIASYRLGTPGLMPSSTGLDRGKVFSPDGDGIRDTLPLTWTNMVAMDSITLTIYAQDGSVVRTIPFGAQAAGPQSFTWDGTSDGTTVLPDGSYILQLTGVAGSTTYYDPTPAPFEPSQFTSVAAVIDTTPSGTYHPIAPVRILDTRHELGFPVPLISGISQHLVVAGKNGVPANAMAVTGNLTVSRATTAGFVRFGSSGVTASTINFPARDDRANGVTLGLAADGSLIATYTTTSGLPGTAQLIFDLTGYFTPGASGATFVPVAPTRIVDTRHQVGIKTALTVGKVATFQVTGLAGVPANAVAVSGNATVTMATGGGYVTVAPQIVGIPPTSSVNFPAGDTRANNVTVQLKDGKLQAVYYGTAGTSTALIFDVTGYFIPGTSGATFVPLTPTRIVDSRAKAGVKGPLASGAAPQFQVVGLASVRTTAVAVVGNLTCTAQTVGSWLAIGPGRNTGTSTLNFPRGDNRANGFVSMLGSGGTLTITFAAMGGSTQALVDILGYYR